MHGVSTRAVDDLVQAMGASGIRKSQVSRLCAELDERVGAFLSGPIEGEWPYLWLDATYVRVCQAGRIVSVAATIAVGVNSDGRREVLGIATGASEPEAFWTDFLRSLARRGLRCVKLVIAGAHDGLKAAVRRVLHATSQRCRVHFMRNARPMPARATAASSRPLDVHVQAAPPLPRPMSRLRSGNGAPPRTSSVPGCRSSSP